MHRKKIEPSPISHLISSPIAKNVVMIACTYQSILDDEKGMCIPRSSQKGQHLALQRRQKYMHTLLHAKNMYGLVQFKDNCWFNCLLMCLLFSDRTRRMMNTLRPLWITSKRRASMDIYNVFEYLMEIPHYNKELMHTIDSNRILTMLHDYDEDLFEHPGYTVGSGILYCRKLLELLFFDMSTYCELRFIQDKKSTAHVHVELNGIPVGIVSNLGDFTHFINDLVRPFKSVVKLLVVFVDVSEPYFNLPKSIHKILRLDSLYMSNNPTHTPSYRHAIAGITCNRLPHLYDGQRALLKHNLKPFNWRVQQKESFAMSYDPKMQLRYNTMKGTRVGFYARSKV